MYLDLLATNSLNVTLDENDGLEVFAKRSIALTQGQFTALRAVDVDGDLDADIVLVGSVAGKGFVKWLENQGSLNFVEHVIADQLPNSLTDLAVADWDGDGDDLPPGREPINKLGLGMPQRQPRSLAEA